MTDINDFGRLKKYLFPELEEVSSFHKQSNVKHLEISTLVMFSDDLLGVTNKFANSRINF